MTFPFKAEELSEVDKLKREIKQLKTMSAVEMMCENESVNQHIIELENRCLKAEAANAELRERLKLFEDGGNRLIKCVDSGWINHALICNYQVSDVPFCNCGINQIRQAIKTVGEK